MQETDEHRSRQIVRFEDDKRSALSISEMVSSVRAPKPPSDKFSRRVTLAGCLSRAVSSTCGALTRPSDILSCPACRTKNLTVPANHFSIRHIERSFRNRRQQKVRLPSHPRALRMDLHRQSSANLHSKNASLRKFVKLKVSVSNDVKLAPIS